MTNSEDVFIKFLKFQNQKTALRAAAWLAEYFELEYIVLSNLLAQIFLRFERIFSTCSCLSN